MILICRQNRTWEKDRRDRLNITFEKLAQLLPEYRPKVNFSKIEILHKTIVYIEDLRKNVKELLSTQNPSILSKFLAKILNHDSFYILNIFFCFAHRNTRRARGKS